jgi:hypothetical protein
VIYLGTFYLETNAVYLKVVVKCHVDGLEISARTLKHVGRSDDLSPNWLLAVPLALDGE